MRKATILKLKDLSNELYTSACCIWDTETDELLAGPEYMGFSAHTNELYGTYRVYHYEHNIRENSDGKMETYFDVYVKRGDR